MGLDSAEVTLASATLSGGARLASAGSGLPQRITTEADLLLDAITNPTGGVFFDPDSLHIWCTAPSGTNAVRKYRISDGSLITSQATVGTAPRGVFRPDSTYYFVATVSSGRAERYDFATLTGTQTTGLTNIAQVVQAASGKIWWRTGTGTTLTETNVGGAATGRTLAMTACQNVWATSGYLYWCDTVSIYQVRETDLVTTMTWTSSGVGGAPGSTMSYRCLYVDASNRPYATGNTGGDVDRWNAATTTIDRRMFWSMPEFGGTANPPSTNFSLGFLAYSDDGRYAAFFTANAAKTQLDAIRVTNVQTQRARFAQAFASDVTLAQIVVPGKHGNHYDGGTSTDLRKTRFYYSFDGGSNRTEFTPGSPLSVAITTGQTLTVDVDFNLAEKPAGNAPYVGGDAGEGITIEWDDPALDAAGGDVSVAGQTTTLATIRDNYIALINALTPTDLTDKRFNRDTKRQPLRRRSKGSFLLREFEITRPGSVEQPGIIDPAAVLRVETLLLTVAYPRNTALYGNDDRDAMHEIVRNDAHQIQGVLFRPDNNVTGQLGTTDVQIEALDESDDAVAFQDISFTVTYYEAQTLA